MNRRHLLKNAALGAAAGAVASCGGGGEGGPAVQTKPRLNWRLASSFPRSLDTIYGAAEVLAEEVEKLSEGRFRIRCYPQGELVPGLQVLDAVQQGTVQLGHSASYYYTGKNPALAFDTAVPFGLDSRQQTAWLTEAGGGELIDELLSDFGILALPAGNTGAQMGGWFRREVGSIADLRGLKMRIPGLGAQVLSELGVTVQTLAGGEIYPALERGAIDATEWVGPYDDEKLGFHRVARYYYYPGWWEPGPNLSVYINRRAWDSLPSLYRDILRCAADTALRTMQARYDALNPPALGRLLAEGVELRVFADDILNAAHATSVELMEQEAAKDAGYRKIYEGWNSFREAAHQWWGTTELAYAQFAYGRG
ncbi:MAG TPA: TRAP transporter substrate-binding protein [Thermoanaerobaculia bacterium]|nr:TRAP transporter substrate-binding protein [Thermoanaerobaculia bacterium]